MTKPGINFLSVRKDLGARTKGQVVIGREPCAQYLMK